VINVLFSVADGLTVVRGRWISLWRMGSSASLC